MAPFSLSWNSFDILRLLRSQEDPFELPGFVSTSPCDGTALPALEAGNELDHTNEYANIFSVDLHPGRLHGTWKWWFGRWFSLSVGWFLGSMLIFWGVQYQNENVCVGILTHTNITYQWHSREKDLFFCHRRAEGLLVFHGFTSMHTKMWIIFTGVRMG